ncbi:ABC transporter permease [Cellulomonas sp. PhB150]|uniref:ABC transporter permease n=1 Tax=Cellulomonas sp. PhB150 TaxID=2485188 RepID=UPI000F4A9971|nr:ABC transporter permease [Cellulomonas sp. PhB150]ROS31094.1 hypothetical protein EDF34_0746 [Cellulomonas sp. PhB150]
MTALSAPAPTFSSARIRVTTGRVVRSEWIKLRTLRSTWVTLGAAVAVLAAFGIIAATSTTAGTTAPEAFSVTVGGTGLAVMFVGALGALVGAREYGSGMIRTTAAAVPRRSRIVVGKGVALTALLAPAAAIGVLLPAGVGSAVQRSHGVPTLALTDPLALRAMLGVVVYLVGIALIGMAVGMILRSVAGSVATVIGLVLVLPPILAALLPAAWSTVLDALPASAGEAFATITGDAAMSPSAGLGAFLAWVVLALGAAVAVLNRRDV